MTKRAFKSFFKQKTVYSYFSVWNFANFSSPSNSFTNKSIFATISINNELQVILNFSSFSCASTVESAEYIRFSCSFIDCNFGVIKTLARHLFIFLILSPNSLKIHTSDSITISVGSFVAWLITDEVWPSKLKSFK